MTCGESYRSNTDGIGRPDSFCAWIASGCWEATRPLAAQHHAFGDVVLCGISALPTERSGLQWYVRGEAAEAATELSKVPMAKPITRAIADPASLLFSSI